MRDSAKASQVLHSWCRAGKGPISSMNYIKEASQGSWLFYFEALVGCIKILTKLRALVMYGSNK